MDFSRYKVLFFGTSNFALPALERLVISKWQITAVVTQPDKPKGRKLALSPTPVKQLAKKLGIPVLEYETLKASTAQSDLKSLSADLAVVAAYGQIIPAEILKTARLGFLNLHPSLLPKYRGASPIQYAILNGESVTGASVILLDNMLDHGPILAQKEEAILPPDDYPALENRLGILAAELLLKSLSAWIMGSLHLKAQDDRQATYTKLLSRDDGKISWTKTAEEISRQIRAFTPWPGTWTTLAGQRIKILRAQTSRETPIPPPAAIRTTKTDLLVGCGNKTLIQILELQPENKSPQSAAAFLRGHQDFNNKIFS